MATYTRPDLRDAVLLELGVIDAQGAMSAEDAKLADDRCQQHLEYLYDQGLINFDLDGSTIPARYFIPLTQVIAQRLMMPYGVIARAQALVASAQGAMRDLHRLKAQRYLGDPQEATYY